MMLSQTEIRILYEIALSIEPKEDMEETAKSALKTYLRKLNCTAGSILEVNQTGSSISYQAISSIPEGDANQEGLEVAQNILPKTEDEFQESLPINETVGRNIHIYIMELPDFGAIILTKQGDGLDSDLISSLRPINRNLANICNLGVMQELERQNERLEQFASIVSHDLRNPLSVAEGRLDILQNNYNSKHLDEIEHSHNRMFDLIDNLLTLAYEGKEVDEVEKVDLKEIAETCWRNIKTEDATLETTSAPTIIADTDRIPQLFENLMRNSIDHGGKGVTIEIGELDSENGFYYEDNGKGIPEKDYDYIFDYGFTSEEKGTGFGLAIVHEIVNAHNWKITVTEGTNGGARFEITNTKIINPKPC